MTTGPKFTANASVAGYLYQARAALALCLRYAYAEGSIEVAVERLDDVSFERDGTPLELLQLKHHLARTADLSDSSPDLWKTIRIWSEHAFREPSLPSRTRLALVTTADVAKGSIAEMLRPSSPGAIISGEQAAEAARRLTAVAETSSNKHLRPAFDALLRLTVPMRASLVSAMQNSDGQPSVDEMRTVIENSVRMVAPRCHTTRAREMLEGWWWSRIIEALVQDPVGTIPVIEVETKLDEIREALQRGALTAEFEHADLPDTEVEAYEDHAFVRQLRAIGVDGNRIGWAKRDYYRAFAQRSHWTRQHVVLDGEMARFESTLIEEWEPRFAAMRDRCTEVEADSPKLREAGQTVYHWVETEARFPFRNLVKRFLNVGSYHMLANAFRVGWHRDFANRR